NPRLGPAEQAYLEGSLHPEEMSTRHTFLTHWIQAHSHGSVYEGVALTPGTVIDWDKILHNCTLAVCIVPQWQPALLRALNQASLARGLRCLPVWLDEEHLAYVGPLVIPYDTACLWCLALRQRHQPAPDMPVGIAPAHDAIAIPDWDAHPLLI